MPVTGVQTCALPIWQISRLVVRRPELRKPVGYDREYLDSYLPNRSSYLPNRSSYLTAADKKRLASLGRPVDGD